MAVRGIDGPASSKDIDIVRTIWPALAGLLLAAPAAAQSVEAPRISADDSWTYQDTIENRTGWHQSQVESTVVRTGADGIETSTKPAGSTMPPKVQLAAADWARFRSVNGHETVVNRPLSFPLRVGKSWQIDYVEDHPNRQHSSEHIHSVYRVVGWEDVVVPAGSFHAIKIEADGEWSAAIAPAITADGGSRVDAQGAASVAETHRITAGIVSGRTFKAFWYVPSVKKWVKSVEEYYDANGIRNERYMDELTSYKVSR